MKSMDFSGLTLGVLGGMGPAATAHFHTLLVVAFNRVGVTEDSAFPRMITLSVPLRGWDHTGATDKTLVATQVRQGVNWLESFGAQVIAIPCNSVHEFVDSSRVINIIDATLSECVGGRTIGVVCSRQTREARLYDRTPEHRYIYPNNQIEIDHIIRMVLEGSRPSVDKYIVELRSRGADWVILGCTEISLCSVAPVFGEFVVDSSRALASAVVRRLIESVK